LSLTLSTCVLSRERDCLTPVSARARVNAAFCISVPGCGSARHCLR
jgi:hypothetical protein